MVRFIAPNTFGVTDAYGLFQVQCFTSRSYESACYLDLPPNTKVSAVRQMRHSCAISELAS